mgnify:CR=1 FL=1
MAHESLSVDVIQRWSKVTFDPVLDISAAWSKN